MNTMLQLITKKLFNILCVAVLILSAGCDNGERLNFAEDPLTPDINATCVETATDFTDTDGDGLIDVCDTDDDDDGLLDEDDNCPLVMNEDQADADADGEGDLCDNDIDGDTILDEDDNCEGIANDDQADMDEDGIGDVCDDDTDGDEIDNAEDNCPLISNADQSDIDQDKTGDVCEDDDDGDGIEDTTDNCPSVSNESQADNDDDGEGDDCDTDDDNDGVLDIGDNCDFDSNADQADNDSDADGDECDTDDDNDGVLDTDDAFPFDATESIDTDADGVGDNSDVCPNVADADQADADADGVGDVCDNCVDDANEDQADLDEDDTGDVCDADADGDGEDSVAEGGADCDDGDEAINTSGVETFDFVDNDCDDLVDDGIYLTDLDVIIDGANRNDQFGYVVARAGDVNGDGYGDVLVSAPYNDDSVSNAGKVYLFYGVADFNGALSAADADVTFEGENSNDNAGISVAGAGDVNADGYADIIIGAYHNDDGGTYAGKVYIIFGSAFATGTNISLVDADVSLTGQNAYDYLGNAVAGAGDVDGDGYADILVAAKGFDSSTTGTSSGKVYFFKGSNLSAATLITNANKTYYGEDTGDAIATSLAAAGDLNHDGYDDFMVGATLNDENGTSSGKVYVFFGKNNFASGGSLVSSMKRQSSFPLFPGVFMTGSTNINKADLMFTGTAAGDYAGTSLAGGYDVNGDDIDDIIIGAKGCDEGAAEAGCAYVIYGDTELTAGTYDLDDAQIKISGSAASDYLGAAVALADDLNGDGIDDIIAGAPYYDSVTGDEGKVGIVLGFATDETTVASSFVLDSVDSAFLGASAGDLAGSSLSSAGDVNGDGKDDIIIGAFGHEGSAGASSGQVYILLNN